MKLKEAYLRQWEGGRVKERAQQGREKRRPGVVDRLVNVGMSEGEDRLGRAQFTEAMESDHIWSLESLESVTREDVAGVVPKLGRGDWGEVGSV
jgi:hypothetical protein